MKLTITEKDLLKHAFKNTLGVWTYSPSAHGKGTRARMIAKGLMTADSVTGWPKLTDLAIQLRAV